MFWLFLRIFLNKLQMWNYLNFFRGTNIFIFYVIIWQFFYLSYIFFFYSEGVPLAGLFIHNYYIWLFASFQWFLLFLTLFLFRKNDFSIFLIFLLNSSIFICFFFFLFISWSNVASNNYFLPFFFLSFFHFSTIWALGVILFPFQIKNKN